MLDRFPADVRSRRIGVHSCPGGDHDSTHSADVDYAALLPTLFELHAGAFYLELAGEADPEAVLEAVAASLRPGQRVFVGVTDPIDPEVETPQQVAERILLAAKHIPVAQLGTTDDCGFSPFADDASTARETAFAKIRARVEGTALAVRAARRLTPVSTPWLLEALELVACRRERAAELDAVLLVAGDERQLDAGSDEADAHPLAPVVHLDDVARAARRRAAAASAARPDGRERSCAARGTARRARARAAPPT